jgi:hypothetical protein
LAETVQEHSFMRSAAPHQRLEHRDGITHRYMGSFVHSGTGVVEKQQYRVVRRASFGASTGVRIIGSSVSLICCPPIKAQTSVGWNAW